MAMTTKKEKKQSKGPAGMTQEELKDLKFKKRIKKMLRSGKPASREYEYDDMSMPPDRRTDEQKKQDAINALLAKGGEVKKYMGGGSVHKKKNKMLTTKGWGASRKT